MREQSILLLALVAFAALAVCFGVAWQRERRRSAETEASVEERVARAVDRSRRTSLGSRLGRVAEQVAPFLPQFPYDPQDARFLGAPVDFVVFDGLNTGEVTQVVFVEVKSGKKTSLSARQEAVQRCVDEGRVAFQTIMG